MSGLTIPYAIPVLEVPGPIGSPLLHPYAANTHCNDGDVVTLGVNVANEIDPAVSNDGSNELLGIIQADSDAVYAQTDTGLQGVFGQDQTGGGLTPTTNAQQLVALFATPGAVIKFNLRNNTGWVSGGTYQANVGTQVGLYKDPTTGIFVLDTQAANKCFKIVDKVQGATTQIVNAGGAQPVGPGGVGDLGAQVYVTPIASTLAVAGGL